ncbi:hypothetical protein CO082_03635 [Candidatus Peregrinibacteria bacterium CG_4_9_14_0_8_um_filter_44_15]|nr:MAG: hypothetical protein AUK45_05245 [Candidatus Peregrinibacteria bacterium CG2_30_44_17]PJB88703.1 MAG: hypothetical protein CO082_03635 [Candidatus Peregrinibacteria bacterium CG_4_9_14_0_8_um_filter_44_15]
MHKRTVLIAISIAVFALIASGCANTEVTEDVTEEVAAEESTEIEATKEETITEEMTDNTEVVTFEISGENFAFSQTEMRVNEGDTVRIVFTSEDGFHDWVLDEFNAATEQVQTGGVTEVTFVADKAGTYEYYCSVGQHRDNGMFGSLIVE